MILARVSPELRDRLQAAADEEGHSLSREIEQRLAESISEPDRTEKSVGGRTTAEFLRGVAYLLRLTEHETGRRWWQDLFTFEDCRKTVDLWFARFRPSGRRIKPKWSPAMVRDGQGDALPGQWAFGRPPLNTPEVRVAMATLALQLQFEDGIPALGTRSTATAGRLVPKMRPNPKPRRNPK